MSLNDVYLVSENLARVPSEDFSLAEKKMGCSLPPGYRQVISRFGVGKFGLDLQLFNPRHIADYADTWRANASGYHFYEEKAPNEVSADRLARSLYIGHTVGGDSLAYLSEDTAGYVLIPDDMDHLSWLGSDLGHAIERICTSAEFSGSAPFMYFEPFNNPQQIVATWMKRGEQLDRVINAMLALRLHDRWFGTPDETVTEIFVRSIGGQITCMTMELLEAQDVPPGGRTTRSEGVRYASPPEFDRWIEALRTGQDLSCGAEIPPFSQWQKLPDIPQSVMVTIRYDRDKENEDLRQVLRTLQELGLKCSAPKPRGW